jgi:hypothetical protein
MSIEDEQAMTPERINELRMLCRDEGQSYFRDILFISNFRTALPEALDEIERLRAALRAVEEEAYEHAARVCDDYSQDASAAFIHHEAFDAAVHCAGGIRKLKSRP